MSDYLSGRIGNWEETLVSHDKYANLKMIPVGTVPPNPTELLENGKFAGLLAQLRTRYDYIFVDCPPIDIVADTQIIEKVTDRTLLWFVPAYWNAPCFPNWKIFIVKSVSRILP